MLKVPPERSMSLLSKGSGRRECRAEENTVSWRNRSSSDEWASGGGTGFWGSEEERAETSC